MDGTEHLLARFVADRARSQPEAVAIDDRGVSLTYAELHQRSAALARGLAAAGLRAGDRVATVTGNSADQVVLFFACAQQGLILVPLSWRLTVTELTNQLDHARPSLLLTEDELSDRARAANEARLDPSPMTLLGSSGVESRVPAVVPSATDGSAEVHDDRPVLMIFTAGTAGEPKAALLTQANCFWTSLALSRSLPVQRDDVVLSVLPQFHVGAWTVQPLLAWWVGATVVLERSFHPGRILQLIAAKHVTTMMGVPAHYLMLAQDPAFDEAELSSLRYAVVGGAPMPQSLLRAWHARGVALAQGYGLTEAGPNVLCVEPGETADSGGRPYAHVDVALADPITGEPLADGPGVGELLVRGPSVFAGYWRDPAATQRTLRGGWLHTGDLARRDESGRYRIVDRIDDIYISGGENVSPAEVENVLFTHPAVADAAVVGEPDDRWGEVGVAYVVRRAGGFTDEAELRALCGTALAAYKVPARVHFVTELPHSGVGKVVRRRLRDAVVPQTEPPARIGPTAQAPRRTGRPQ